MPEIRYPGYENHTHPGHAALAHLRAGKVLDLQGLRYKMVVDGAGQEMPLERDCLYIGARNTVDIYKLDHVEPDTGWVFPQGSGYPFDVGECVRVMEMDEDAVSEDSVVFALP